MQVSELGHWELARVTGSGWRAEGEDEQDQRATRDGRVGGAWFHRCTSCAINHSPARSHAVKERYYRRAIEPGASSICRPTVAVACLLERAAWSRGCVIYRCVSLYPLASVLKHSSRRLDKSSNGSSPGDGQDSP